MSLKVITSNSTSSGTGTITQLNSDWNATTGVTAILNKPTLVEYTGFTNNQNIVVSYDSVNRKITLTGTFEAFYEGVKVEELVSGWVSSSHTNLAGSYYLYYNGTELVWSTSPWSFSDLMIAYVQYGTNNMAIREVHGTMSWQAHKEFHETTGTYRQSGGGITGIVLDSTTPANKRPDVDATLVNDEDLPTTISALSSKLYTQRFLSGAGVRSFNVDMTDIINLSGNVPYWNQYNGSNWVQTLFNNNEYGAIFLVAIPTTSDSGSQKYRYLWVQPQEVGTLEKIQTITPNSLVHGDSTSLVSEFVFIGKLIIQCTGNDWKIVSNELLNGSRNIQTSSVSGNYLTSVTHDTTLTGLGTASSPLGVVVGNVVNTTTVGSMVNLATTKTTPVDADMLPLMDSAASNVIKKLSWLNVKATLKTYFDTLYNKYVHPNHTGDVTSVADGATTISANVVTNTKLADMAVNTIKGRVTAGTGDPEDLTATQVRTMLNVADGAEVNQNAFSNVAVSGQTTVSADSKTDTLTLVAGTNVTITTDSTTDSITISANDTSVEWGEIQNKPDPTITLAGDASGSVTLTDLGSGTLTVTVLDDSHDHVITNVDGLQTALDAKLSNNYLSGRSLGDANLADGTGITVNYLAAGGSNRPSGTDHALLSMNYSADWSVQLAGDWRTNDFYTRNQNSGTWGSWQKFWHTGNDGASSGLDADLLDGQHGSYYLDWSNVTNKPDPVITLAGDATGSVTLTDVGSGTLTVTVLDDSHNHIISNVDGLQTTLDGKASSVHTHAISDVTNLQTTLDSKAPLNSPALTGTPTAPTPLASSNDTQIATTSFVKNAVITSGGVFKFEGTAIIPTTGWNSHAGDYAWTLNLDIAGISDLDFVDVIVDLEDIDTAIDCELAPTIANYVGGITFYAKSIPSAPIGITYAVDELNTTSYAAGDILTKLKTVDGATSGLDSDLLDGQEGSYYLAWTNLTSKPTTLSGYGITDATPSSHVGSTGAAHGVATTSVNGFMSSADKTKLDGVATNANNYVHPTTDGNLHVPATGTTNNGKALIAGSTAGSFAWTTLTSSMVGLGNVTNESKATMFTSPTFTGTPISTTAAVGTNTTQIATTAFVNAEIANDAAPIAHVGATGTAHGVVTTSVNGFMSSTDKTKLDGITDGAQPNQNAFSNFAVSGQTTVSADTYTDTVTLVAGTNVTITTDAVNDSITISANDVSVDWSEIQNKPDPVITLSGDVTGSGTMTDVGSVTITTAVGDDSHNHTDTTITSLDASKVSSGTLSGARGVTAGSTSSSFLTYAGTTNTAGQFYGGTTNPTGTTRLNYSGYFYPTFLNLASSSDTATAASHYMVETGSDGFVRPKTLANVKAEILASAALSGTPTAPTPTAGDSSTKIATTAFVASAISSAGGASKLTGSITIPNTGWVANTGDYAYKLDLAISGMLVTDSITVNITQNDLDVANDCEMASYTLEYAGGTTLYAKSVPSASMSATYVIIR